MYLKFAPASNCWTIAAFLADLDAVIYTGIWLRHFSLTNFHCDTDDVNSFGGQLIKIANKISGEIICLKG